MIISVASIKGGVGKSCSVACIAGALARNTPKPFKTLVVDFDASAALTHSLSSKSNYRFKASLSDIFLGKCKIDQAIHEYEKNLFLIPTSTAWGKVKEDTIEKYIQKFTDEIKSKFDIVIFDLSPAIYFGSILPLSYSDYAIIPVQSAGGISLLGLDAQMEVIAQLHEQKKFVNVLGIYATFTDKTKMSKEVVEYLQKECPDEFINIGIRKNTSLAQAAAMGKLIYEHSPNCNGAKDYKKLTKEIVKRLKKTKGK